MLPSGDATATTPKRAAGLDTLGLAPRNVHRVPGPRARRARGSAGASRRSCATRRRPVRLHGSRVGRVTSTSLRFPQPPAAPRPSHARWRCRLSPSRRRPFVPAREFLGARVRCGSSSAAPYKADASGRLSPAPVEQHPAAHVNARAHPWLFAPTWPPSVAVSAMGFLAQDAGRDDVRPDRRDTAPAAATGSSTASSSRRSHPA